MQTWMDTHNNIAISINSRFFKKFKLDYSLYNLSIEIMLSTMQMLSQP